MKNKILRKNILWTSLLCMYLLPMELSADNRLKLPRDINGIEILVGGGASYDETANLGETTLTEFSPTFALMSDRFYLDIHKVAYRFYPKDDTILTAVGMQGGLPNEEDIPAYLNIKGGDDSYDIGLMAEKQFGTYRVEAMALVDVTGTHDGMLLELATGYDYYSKKSHFEVTLGARYQDKNRNNYLYGVTPKESTSRLASYDAKGDVTAFLHANYTYELYKNLGITVGGSITSLSDTAKKSPRIKDDAKYQEVELFTGLIWQFSVYH
ncbi:MAG: MipA/OmpV family protein [Sulfurovaceae bacterium]|nr:MipA/OmpV family protein [Sulfurovaceae bacterium]